MKHKQKLGEESCDAILVIHALLDCDTTSRMYAIGNATILHKSVSPHKSMQNILVAGEKLPLIATSIMKSKD